jgi:hypothetical protein
VLLCGVCYVFDDSPPTKQGKQVILSSPELITKSLIFLYCSNSTTSSLLLIFALRAWSFHADDMNARLAFDLVSGGFFRTSKYPKFECFIVSLIMSPNLNLLLDLKYQTLSVITSVKNVVLNYQIFLFVMLCKLVTIFEFNNKIRLFPIFVIIQKYQNERKFPFLQSILFLK